MIAIEEDMKADGDGKKKQRKRNVQRKVNKKSHLEDAYPASLQVRVFNLFNEHSI